MRSERGDLKTASSYFEAALRYGSPFEAYYYLADLQVAQMKNMPAALKPGACSIAAAFYKVAAERGSWDEDLIREGEDAWETGTLVGKQLALLKWWIAAERGFELGQNNMAFILDQGMSSLTRFTTRRGPLIPSRQKYAPSHQRDALECHGEACAHTMDTLSRTE